VKGTLFKFKVETKPIIVRDTIITKVEKEKAKIKKEKTKKNEEKAKENPKKTKTFLAFLLCFIVSGFLTFRKKK
jgi:hypothetical protein